MAGFPEMILEPIQPFIHHNFNDMKKQSKFTNALLAQKLSNSDTHKIRGGGGDSGGPMTGGKTRADFCGGSHTIELP